MKVALLQYDIVQNDATANMAKVDALTATLPPVDLVVMPEMFHCGYTMDRAQMIGPQQSAVTDWMQARAQALGATLMAGVAVQDADGKCFNRLMCIGPDGTRTHYDKRHLFRLGTESSVYTAGSRRTVVSVAGVRCLMQICYDARFPVWSRNRGDYDAAVYVSNWPTARIDTLLALLKARAIENQCYVIGVNRTGKADGVGYPGLSTVFDPLGRIVAQAAADTECALVADIDLEPLQGLRSKFNVLADADEFCIDDKQKNI